MPAAQARYDIVKEGATIPDTLKMIVAAVNVCSRSPYVIQLTKQLNPTGDKKAFIKRLFDWVCVHVPYILDQPGDEEVWTPELTIKEGRGDCKKMTVLIASVLKCAGIEPVIKHVYYTNEDAENTHVYVIVPYPDLQHYLTVDPVNHKQWNTEVKGIRDVTLNFLNGKIMKLHMMGSVPGHRIKAKFGHGMPHLRSCIQGIDDEISITAGNMSNVKDAVIDNALEGYARITGLDEEAIQGIGSMGRRTKAERRQRRKNFFNKLKNFAKKTQLAPMRASFLLLVRSNIFKLANRMAKAWMHDPKALTDMWKNWGGKPEKLKGAIKKGAWKSISKGIHGVEGVGCPESRAKIGALANYDDGRITVEQMESMEGIGFPPAIAAAIAAATPIVLAVIKIIGRSKDDQDTESPAAEGAADAVEAVNESIQTTQGIGYMHDEDEIAGPGEPYDYIDGMGRRRKKNKGARKQKRKARKAARRSKKKEGSDDAGEDPTHGGGYSDQDDMVVPKKHRITNQDIEALSTLAEYGGKKIMEGKVTFDQVNKMVHEDDGGTKDSPLSPPKSDSGSAYNVPHESTAHGSFGLTEINSLPTMLHWLKGAMVIAMAGAVGSTLLSDVIIIGSLIYLLRKPFFKLFNLKK